MKSNHRRVFSGMAANLYGQLVTVVTQLASVPIFLSRWSAAEYGQWLILSVIPVYLAMADAGILTVAGNKMTMHRARGETAEVDRIFGASLKALAIFLPVLTLACWGVLAAFGFGLSVDERLALAALCLAALVSLACSLFDAAYRAHGRYAQAMWMLGSARIADWLGTIAGVFLGGTLLAAGLGYLTGRVLAFAIMYRMARRDLPELRWSLRGAHPSESLGLVKEGYEFLAFSVGNLLTIQGMILVVGGRLGPVAVAAFGPFRTLSRVVTQLAILGSKALAPELSALHGAGKFAEADALARHVGRIVTPVSFAVAAGLCLMGRPIIETWGHGKIPFDGFTLYLLLVGAVASAYWQVRAVRLTATNQHSGIARAFLLVSVLALPLSWALIGWVGLHGAGWGLLLADMAMIPLTLYFLQRQVPAAFPPAMVARRVDP